MLEQYVDDFIDEDIFPQGKLFRIIFDNVTAKFRLLAKYDHDLKKIIDSFSTYNSGSFFAAQYGYAVEAKKYTVDKFGYFSIGLIFEILEYLKREYSSTSCVAISRNVKRFILDYLLPLKSFISTRDRTKFQVSNISNEIKLRPYQEEAIKAILFDGCGRGLIELPTGSGKSFVIANLIYTLLEQYDSRLKTLICVPTKQLVDQFYKDLLSYGYKAEDLTMFTAGLKKNQQYNPNAKIIIGNRQYIFQHKDKIPKLDIVVGDEAHTIGEPESSTYKFIESINCSIKVGCSGTLPRENYKKWALMGLFSRILYVEDVVKLQEEGYLTKLTIDVLSITDEIVEKDTSLLFNLKTKNKYSEDSDIAFNDSYNAEVQYMKDNCIRLFKPMVDKIESLEGNVLVLFDRIEFGRELFDFIKEKFINRNIFYIDGSISIDTREEIRKKAEETGNNIILGQNSVMSTGINIKRLSNICFTSGGKSMTRCIQSIGRTLRLHETKKCATIIDCVFNFKYSRKHFSERLRLYKEFYRKNKPDIIEKISI